MRLSLFILRSLTIISQRRTFSILILLVFWFNTLISILLGILFRMALIPLVLSLLMFLLLMVLMSLRLVFIAIYYYFDSCILRLNLLLICVWSNIIIKRFCLWNIHISYLHVSILIISIIIVSSLLFVLMTLWWCWAFSSWCNITTWWMNGINWTWFLFLFLILSRNRKYLMVLGRL